MNVLTPQKAFVSLVIICFHITFELNKNYCFSINKFTINICQAKNSINTLYILVREKRGVVFVDQNRCPNIEQYFGQCFETEISGYCGTSGQVGQSSGTIKIFSYVMSK